MLSKRLIFGCGYLGRRVAERWLAAGDDVTAVTRSEERAGEFHSAGISPIIADITKSETLASLPSADTVLIAVGYDRHAGPSIFDVYATGVRNILAALSGATGRVVYISTTGVYGDAGGGWVDEQTPPNPGRDGGKASLAAEQELRGSRFDARGFVLRLAGLYGPGRIPFLQPLESGEPIAAVANGWLNLIHVEDAADIVACVAEVKAPSSAYCVSDGSPVVRQDYYRQVATLIGAPQPSFVTPPADSPRAARARSNRRISNQKLLSEIAPRLTFPTYREGLSSILGNRESNG